MNKENEDTNKLRLIINGKLFETILNLSFFRGLFNLGHNGL